MSKHWSRLTLIVKRLQKGPATYQEVANFLKREFELIDTPYSFSQRTLQRDIKDIAACFSIEILNEQKGDRRYYISEKPDTVELTERLLNAYELVNILSTSQKFASVILPEQRTPGGLEHFHGLLYAIQSRKILTFSHFKFWDETLTERKVHPLALKESLGRWYLVAVDSKDKKLKTFGLDRMLDIIIGPTSFREKYDYDIQEYFKHSFGIIAPEGGKPQLIRLSFASEQGKYVKSFPLHHSQRLVSENDDQLVIELEMIITHDFVMELMKYGPELTVLAPKSLRQQIKKLSTALASKYEL